MARTVAKKAAAPSPAAKGKVAATKPADAALTAAEATKTPVDQTAAGDTTTGAPAAPVVGLPTVVAAAVLSLATDAPGDTADADAIAATDSADAGPVDADAAAGADELVTAFGFTLPVVFDFPVVLTLTNAWQGSHDVAGTNETLAPGETRDVEFTEAAYNRFSRVILQLADLHGWTDGQGVLVEQGADHGED